MFYFNAREIGDLDVVQFKKDHCDLETKYILIMGSRCKLYARHQFIKRYRQINRIEIDIFGNVF